MFQHQTLTSTINSSDIEIAYQYKKGTNDQLILCIHGLGCDKQSFEDIWSEDGFAEYSILAPDLIGYGESSKPENFDYTLEHQAEALFSLLENFEYSLIHIIGHSMGGAVGLLLTKHIKNDLGCFISVEGNLIDEDCGLLSRKATEVKYEVFSAAKFQELIDLGANSGDTGFQFWSKQCQNCTPLAFYKNSLSLVEWSESGKLFDTFLNLPNRAYVFGDKIQTCQLFKNYKKHRLSHIQYRTVGIL